MDPKSAFRGGVAVVVGAAAVFVHAAVGAQPTVQSPPLEVRLALKTSSSHGGPVAFAVTLENNTAKEMELQALFGPPLSGRMVQVPAHGRVETSFEDHEPAICGTRDYSAQAQGHNPQPTIRVRSTCTFAATTTNAWTTPAMKDKQASALYLDALLVGTPPVCRSGAAFMSVRAAVMNHTAVEAKGLVVQLLAPNGSLLGATPAFDLKPGASSTKVVDVSVPISGKLEMKLLDPKGSAVNPGVYVDVAPACSFNTEPIPSPVTGVAEKYGPPPPVPTAGGPAPSGGPAPPHAAH
jgi:hypothetical protein